MKVSIAHLHILLKKLCLKTNLSLSRRNLQIIGGMINDNGGKVFSENYLYKNIHDIIKDKNETEEIGLREDQLNRIAAFLGFTDFRSFINSLTHKDSQLSSLVGNYYSYVRRNAEPPMLFRSPVRIWEETDGKVLYSLKGPSHVFTGEVKCRLGCLFVLMESEEGKAFLHVYRIGIATTPHVLQGTFSGISTALNPIGGRTVLIRMEQAYESLSGEGLLISDLKKSKALDERKLAIYFNEYNNNNVKPNIPATFGLDDLEQ